jgi:uncharacterized membrane protein YfcA
VRCTRSLLKIGLLFAPTWNRSQRADPPPPKTRATAPNLYRLTVPSSQNRVSLGTAMVIGIMAGLLGGMFGVGGGLIIVPALASVAKMDRRRASGTSLAATLPIAAAALVTYVANGNVDWAVALCLATGAIAGAVVGTHLLSVIPKNVLTIIFVITVLATATRLGIGTETTGRADLSITMVVMLILVGLFTGTLAGLLGIGGGVIMVPAMVVLFGMVPIVAKGTSVAVIIPTSIMGTFRNRQNANVDLRVATIVGGFGAVSAVAGGLIASDLSDRTSNMMFALLLLVVAATQVATLRKPKQTAQPSGS